jgi:outer membrane biosynthesis protein TonB
MIGKLDTCDISVNDSTLNPYHAILSIEEYDKVFIMDLGTVNGTTVNGENIVKKQIIAGDLITLGSIEFRLEDHSVSSSEYEDVTREITLVRHLRLVDEQPPELPPEAKESSVNKGYLFEGEWCDIKFSEATGAHSDQLEIEDKSICQFDSYIDVDERKFFDIYNGDQGHDEVIEVVYTSCGNIISFDTLPFKKNALVRPNKLLSQEVLRFYENSSIFDYNGSQVKLAPPSGFTHVNKDSSEAVELASGHDICFEKGTHQIHFRIRGATDKLAGRLPYREKEKLQYILLLFFLFFIPSFMLLLVDVMEEPEPEKEVVVIYRPKKQEPIVEKSSNAKGEKKAEKEAPKLAAEKSVEKTKEQKVEKKSKTTNTKKVKKSKKVAKKSNKKANQVRKKVAKKKAAPVKKIDFSSKFSSALASKKSSKKSFKASKSNVSASSKSLAINSKSDIKAVGQSNIGSLKTSGKFGGNAGYKSKGMGKSKFDSQLTAFKTVVLGSIDPELLRKLLREYIPQFRYCYQQELSRNSKVKGKINLEFTINKNGSVTRSNVYSRKGKFGKRGINCIGRVLNMIKFPKPKGGGIVEVKQPLNFSSEKTKV